LGLLEKEGEEKSRGAKAFSSRASRVQGKKKNYSVVNNAAYLR
jgi:hypothetical protein